MKVLIVEDHFLVAEALRLVLEEAGLEVVGTAASTPEAVRLAGKRRPDLALVDLQLAHGTSGIEAARAMRRQHPIAVLFVTGNPDAARAARDAALGILIKPYRDEDVLAAIRAVEQLLRGEAPSIQAGSLEFFPFPPDGRR